MRHLKAGWKLSRSTSHRRAMRNNLVTALFSRYGTAKEFVETTREKAKFARPFAERLITLGRKGREARVQADASANSEERARFKARELQIRRRVASLLGGGKRVRKGHGSRKKALAARGEGVRSGDRPAVVRRLLGEIAERYAQRPGGYTRIVALPRGRLGDNAVRVIWELVRDDDRAEQGRRHKGGDKGRVRPVVEAGATGAEEASGGGTPLPQVPGGGSAS
ncbi:MAG: hypothetical protein HY722_07320 [Planctomycetes bacterium]|nr:hypothetical protein [Planctomycetota bacterium]